MNKLLSKTFLWMFVGLLVTFITGYVVSINENMLNAIYSGYLYWLFVVIELGLVIYFSTRVLKMQPTSAKICFLLYSFVSGLTFSSIFIAFNISSIIYVFLICALLFGIFGLIGYYTKLDLSKISTYLLMGLIGVVLCTVINIFVNNSTFNLVITIIAVLLFLAYTAYDIKKIKTLSETSIDTEIIAINGAFELYLDFINIFINLLSLIGDSRD